MDRRRRLLEPEGWEFQSERLFDRIEVQPGWICLDLGCESADVLVSLSRRVGALGFVVGVDSDALRLATPRALVQAHDLSNVEVLMRDRYATRLPRQAFDLVYARLCEAPLDRHADLLTEVLALTRPGGIAAIRCLSWDATSPSRSIEVWGRKRDRQVHSKRRI